MTDTGGGRGVEFEDVGEGFFRDQHAYYTAWRQRGGAQPVHFPGPLPLQGWVITGYADAKAALADPRLAKDTATERYAAYIGETSGGPGRALTAHMLNADPPEHTRLRKLVQKAYTARRVEELRPRIAELVNTLLDGLCGAREADLISRFALPLPIAVAFELFGGTGLDHAQFAVRGKSVDGGHGDGEVSGRSWPWCRPRSHSRSCSHGSRSCAPRAGSEDALGGRRTRGIEDWRLWWCGCGRREILATHLTDRPGSHIRHASLPLPADL